MCARSVALLFLPFILLGQGFDVVAIKKNVSGSNASGTPPLENGRLWFTNVTVKDVMSLAYFPIDYLHLHGGPAWIGSERYDIEAKTEDRVVSEERYRQLLQRMLADRFQLKVHQEAHEESVYLLVPDKKGMKLKATDLKSCGAAGPEVNFTPNGTACRLPIQFNGTHYEAPGTTTKNLVLFLGLYTGRPVLDRSGSEGMVDIKLDFIPANHVSTDAVDGPPSIFEALPAQLGLRLQPGKGPVDSIMIDHVEKPSEN